VEKIYLLLHFLTNQHTLSRFLADLVHFNGPELPEDQFLIAKKQFLINTSNVKGFLFQQRKAHGCLNPSKSYLQPNVFFVLIFYNFRALQPKKKSSGVDN
jgi:hypothetical protein